MKPYEVLTVCGSEYHFKLTTANAVRLEAELKTDLLSGLAVSYTHLTLPTKA